MVYCHYCLFCFFLVARERGECYLFIFPTSQNSNQRIQQSFCICASPLLLSLNVAHKNMRMHSFTLAISTPLGSAYCRLWPRFKLNILCVYVVFAWAHWGRRDLSVCSIPVKACEWLQIHYPCETILQCRRWGLRNSLTHSLPEVLIDWDKGCHTVITAIQMLTNHSFLFFTCLTWLSFSDL